MNRIVYIDGELADKLGLNVLQELAARMAEISNMSVDILTHGTSEFHERSRYTALPKKGAKP